MKRSKYNYRTVLIWVLSLVVVLSMVFGFVASLSYERPQVTPTPTYAVATWTPVAATATPAPQAATPEPPKANPPAPSPTPAE